MKQSSQQIFLEFLIAENKELKAFIKSVVEKSLKIDKPVISGGPMPFIGITGAATLNSGTFDQYSNIQAGFGSSFPTAQAINPIKESENLIDKVPATTPEEVKEKNESKGYLNNIFGMG